MSEYFFTSAQYLGLYRYDVNKMYVENLSVIVSYVPTKWLTKGNDKFVLSCNQILVFHILFHANINKMFFFQLSWVS